MCVQHPRLQRPGTPRGIRSTSTQWKRRVLMPDYQPVRRHRLVEQRRAKGHHARADKVRGNLQQPGIGGKFENDWYAEHVPRTGFGPRNWRVGECVEGSQHLSALEHLMVDGKPCLSLVHAKENVSCRLANVANEPRAAANIMDEAAGASAPFDG